MKEKEISKIEKAIKELNLKQKDLDIITLENMEKVCKMASVDLLDLMKYLRHKRGGEKGGNRMEVLTLKDLVDFVLKAKQKGMPLDTTIYLGNDDELNGVHNAWYIEVLDREKMIDLELSSLELSEVKDINILIS